MDECRLIRGGAGFHGMQGLDYFAGVSAESAGARSICMHLPVRAVLARTDPNEQESVVLLDGRD